MTVRYLYLKALDKLNKVISNNEQDIPEHVFVYNFNEAQDHWVANNYKLDEANRPIADNLEDLLEPFYEVKPSSSNSMYSVFDQPDNLRYYNNSYTLIDDCPRVLENHLKRNQDIINLLKNSDWEPSKEFEQTLITLGKKQIFVYHNGKFTPNALMLTYYRTPRQIDMEDGFTHLNGELTKDVFPEWTDQTIIEEILDLTVQFIAESYSDTQRVTTISNHIKQTSQQILK
jgi:hypothetical protein